MTTDYPKNRQEQRVSGGGQEIATVMKKLVE